MSASSSLPQLPLILAGIPRPVVELLRTSGIPVAALPRVSFFGGAYGRFLLFDSRHPTANSFLRRAVRRGMQSIDLAELTGDLPVFQDHARGTPAPPVAERRAWLEAMQFLRRLKATLEQRGGLWLRLAELPFPYQRGFAWGLVHEDQSTVLEQTGAAASPAQATHFVSPRLRQRTLRDLREAGVREIGWHVQAADLGDTPAQTLTQWKLRLTRAAHVGWKIFGLLPHTEYLALPSTRSLRELGLGYSCHRNWPQLQRALREGEIKSDRTWIRLLGMTVSPENAAEILAASGIQPGATRISLSLPEHTISRRRDDAHHAPAAMHLEADHVLADDHRTPCDPVADTAILDHAIGRASQLELLAPAGRARCLLLPAAQPALWRTLDVLSKSAPDADRCWRPTLSQLAHWQQLQRRLKFRVWKQPDGYEIHADGIFSEHTFALEIWRGGHRATIPVRAETLTLKENGLVYLEDESAGVDLRGLPVTEPETTLPRALASLSPGPV